MTTFCDPGYRGLDRPADRHVSLFNPPKLSVSGKKKAIVGQAFGVGAFEEEDEDIYGREDVAAKYDFYLDEPDPDNNKRARKSRWSQEPAVTSSCLEGFIQAETKSALLKSFPLPDLPKDFKPKCNVKPSRYVLTSPLSSQERKR